MVNALAKTCHIPILRKGRLAHSGEGHIDGIPVVLGKPRTYVNLSGKAAVSMLQAYKLAPSRLLVVYDDLDLPLGKIRIREGGSSGGHNGMRSMIVSLGTEDFPRLRIGIGRPTGEDEVVGHVLGGFSAAERNVAEEAVQEAAAAVVCIVSQGVAAAMNRFNR